MTEPAESEPSQDVSAGDTVGTPLAALQGGLGKVVSSSLSGDSASASGVIEAVGGWRGVAESLLPATVYLLVFVITRDARLSAIAPLTLAALALIWRLARREAVAPALSGAFGMGICVAAVFFSGNGSSFFVPGFFINAAWMLAHLVSLLIGWPLIGLLLGMFRGSLTEWRGEPALRRAAQLLTVVWIALFASRLAVQLPLFFAEKTTALGLARLVMGMPLFALAIFFTWLVLSKMNSKVSASSAPSKDEQVPLTSSSDE